MTKAKIQQLRGRSLNARLLAAINIQLSSMQLSFILLQSATTMPWIIFILWNYLRKQCLQEMSKLCYYNIRDYSLQDYFSFLVEKYTLHLCSFYARNLASLNFELSLNLLSSSRFDCRFQLFESDYEPPISSSQLDDAPKIYLFLASSSFFLTNFSARYSECIF